MKFLIQNTTPEDRFIIRFNGEQLRILAYDFIVFDSEDVLECKYWSNIAVNPINGITVITDLPRIQLLNKLKSCGKYNKPIVETTVNTITEENTVVQTEPSVEVVQLNNVETEETEKEFINTANTIVDAVVKEPLVENTADIISVEDMCNESTDEVVLEESTSYTEEELSTKSRSELLDILDSMGIEYRKNNSNSKLISMIIENYKK